MCTEITANSRAGSTSPGAGNRADGGRAEAHQARTALIRSLAEDGAAVLPILGAGAPGAGTPGAGTPGAGTPPAGTMDPDGGVGDAAATAVRHAIGGIVIGFHLPHVFDADTQAFRLALAQQCAPGRRPGRAHDAAQAARWDAEAARRAGATNQAKSEFQAVMRHELRSALNAIGGYVERMEMGVRGRPVTPEQRVDPERIQRAQRHLLGLINAALNYAKVDAGAVHYDVPTSRGRRPRRLRGARRAAGPRGKGLVLRYEPAIPPSGRAPTSRTCARWCSTA